MRSKKCVLCGWTFRGYGHNPAPLAFKGRCCGDCNTIKVIPTRFNAVFKLIKDKPLPKQTTL